MKFADKIRRIASKHPKRREEKMRRVGSKKEDRLAYDNLKNRMLLEAQSGLTSTIAPVNVYRMPKFLKWLKKDGFRFKKFEGTITIYFT